MCWCTCVFHGQLQTSISDFLINTTVIHRKCSMCHVLSPPYYIFIITVESHLAFSHSFKKSTWPLTSMVSPQPVPRWNIWAMHLTTTSIMPSAHAAASAVCSDRVASWEAWSSHPECGRPPGGWVIGSPEVCRAAGGVSDSVARSALRLWPSNQRYHSNSFPNTALVNTSPVVIVVFQGQLEAKI